ncbi:MAG: hypothetical protein ASARMPREDX12_000407 [Alectoria sarmentosa]|nr:MAG: hypothetical protein ASARMPREDX12_000407 [Alectoria sarmentosa]
MATITVPSPSAFLRSPVRKPVPTPTPTPKVTVKASSKKKSAVAKHNRKTCKEKRLKCDETKPVCQQCDKKGVQCEGYEKVLKWRPQEDTFRTKPTSPRLRKKSVSLTVSRPPPPPAAVPSLLPESSGSPNTNSLQPVLPSYPTPPQSATPLVSQRMHPSRPEPPTIFPFQRTLHAHEDISPLHSRLKTENSFSSSTPSLINDGFDDEIPPESATTAPSTIWSDNSPKLENLLLPGTDLNARPPDFMDYEPTHIYRPSGFSNVPSLRTYASSSSEEEVEEIMREPDTVDAWAMAFPSPGFSDSSSSSDGSRFSILSAAIYGQPILHPDSEEMLTMRFDTQTCGILSIKDGPTENPWRMKLWPMARESPALRYAINAMTAFHASKEKPSLRIRGMQDFGNSLKLLSAGIQDTRIDISLATTLVLAFAESWDQLISTGITHLRGAKRLVSAALINYRQGSLHPEVEARLSFLCRTWVYMDVIARLTSLDGDECEDFDTVLSPLCGPSAPSQGIDPLMGCASTLFPLIGRAANLIRKVRTSGENSLPIVSQASELKDFIEKWKVPVMLEAPEDQSTEIQHSERTAEAYRWATLLYLHQAVPEIHSGSVTGLIAGMAKVVLNNLANVPPTSRAVIIHIFPLLAASCEVIGGEDRKWVADRWEAMMARMNIQNIDKCWIVVKEVWERRDNREQERRRQGHRAAADHLLTGYMPTKCMKRKMSAGDDGIHEINSSDGSPHRAAQITKLSPSTKSRFGMLRKESSAAASSGLDYELTVRGDLHWAGVMKDWKWEVLLG